MHINDDLLNWKSNLWLINVLYFSIEQIQVLSTLNMINIRFLQMIVEAEQQGDQRTTRRKGARRTEENEDN